MISLNVDREAFLAQAAAIAAQAHRTQRLWRDNKQAKKKVRIAWLRR